jgi:hypothetical protein
MRVRERLAKAGFACLIGASISAAVPVSALAIAPVGMLVLLVTDCKSGQPITAGEAIFSARVGTAVAPIENGVVGPVGLGDLKFVLNLTSPGYRVLHRVLQGTGVGSSPLRTIRLCLHPVAGNPERVVTTTYRVDVNCSPVSGQVCNPPYSTPISSADILKLQLTASSTNCSPITVTFRVDGFDVYYSDQLGPDDSTPLVSVGPVIPGTHQVSVQATGVEGGCNAGTLASWSGTLTVVTAQPVGPTTKAQCLKGGWSNFSAFQNQGECVNYVSTAGKHA